MRVKHPPAQHQDIGIVVFLGHARHELIGNQRRTHAGKLVGNDRHADPGAADQNSALSLAPGNGTGHLFGKIGIIDRIAIVGTEV